MAIQTIETTDLFKGAYLLCSGGILHDITFRRNGRQTAFFVIEGYSLNKLDNEYMNGKALVNPLQFRETLNKLRDILFEKLNKHGRDRNDKERHIEHTNKSRNRNRQYR